MIELHWFIDDLTAFFPEDVGGAVIARPKGYQFWARVEYEDRDFVHWREAWCWLPTNSIVLSPLLLERFDRGEEDFFCAALEHEVLHCVVFRLEGREAAVKTVHHLGAV